ncbi:MAG: hypothetical protein COV74_10865 [Candidatus Omnitrophica bacterium CG11_big_fil_rev_8_21_14_0_20_45_26]|uniref:PilZ domain-containing protein n=1 Tax=Candidatus Abzuiibacterium crystallinum TaxID=1974748 RepID=A0A2H0LKZ5_9BACT|nr:MAG: hypothetical protein COV74_10865 [Candidatus Omnitrophica bacterium CG11_big_fil_rev_8_21_14_0_20_45_26]PIW63833.1 MAG: hypothetical protein COW12_07945 [Candidatus Omnitrophica bacterium CG12_big_fil_rev_8_21_14_0_65_45_16]
MAPFNEKRKWLRVEKKIKIDAIVVDPGKEGALFKLDPLWTKDVGGNGLGLITKARLAVGVSIDLKFQLPGQDKLIEAKGRVVWSKLEDGSDDVYRIGVAFQEINDKDRLVIMKFVESEAKKVIESKKQP